MPAPTIVVVDDDPDQAETLAQILSEVNPARRVHAYSDPIRALAAVAHHRVDLLIADVSMPWLDGQDIVASLRERRPELTVFLVSGYSRGAEIAAREGLRFFPKPLDYDLLCAAVDQALGQAQETAALAAH